MQILKALGDEALPLAELRGRVGTPPQTTLRTHLRTLRDLGVVDRQEEAGFPGPVDYELTAAGRYLADVGVLLDLWLTRSPSGELSLGASSARSVVNVLVEAWKVGIFRALAVRPLSLTELARLITTSNYPSLERRLGALRSAGLVERFAAHGRGTPYGPTDWMRRAVGPLTMAAAWERHHLLEGAQLFGKIDTETTFLLAVPLLRLPSEVSGTCRLAVEITGDTRSKLAGVVVEAQDGKVVRCVSHLEGKASSWAVGSVSSWQAAALHGETRGLEIGGSAQLVFAVLDRLNREVRPPL